MTDDEMAESVQDGLAGIRRCPECGKPMLRRSRLHLSHTFAAPVYSSKPAGGGSAKVQQGGGGGGGGWPANIQQGWYCGTDGYGKVHSVFIPDND